MSPPAAPAAGLTASVSTTPLRPLELPPFALYPLIDRVFAPSSTAASPTKQPPSSPPSSSLSRLGQLVGASTGAEGSVQASVRSVEASGDKVWIGGSDGRVRFYEVDHDAGQQLGRSLSPTSHMLSGRRTPTSPSREPVRGLRAACGWGADYWARHRTRCWT